VFLVLAHGELEEALDRLAQIEAEQAGFLPKQGDRKVGTILCPGQVVLGIVDAEHIVLLAVLSLERGYRWVQCSRTFLGNTEILVVLV
jgi:hypothetical protein